MNINMENKIVRFLLDGADLTNGCSVVRRALWRTAQCVLIGIGAALILMFLCFVVAGLALYVYSPWFSQFDIDLSLSWLGNSWWADMTRMGAKVGVGAIVVGTLIGAFIGLLFFIFAAKEGKIQPLNKVIVPIAEGTAVVTGAMMAIGHRFCPKIEVQWPAKFIETGLVEGALLTLDRDQENDADIVWKVTGTGFTKDKERIRVTIQDVKPEYDWREYCIMYNIAEGYVDEGYKIIPSATVVEEKSPA